MLIVEVMWRGLASFSARLERGLCFSACCLPLIIGGVATSPASAADWTTDLSTTARWDSNATNADRSWDVLGAFQLRAEFEAMRRISLGRDDALFLGAHLAAEAWPRFDGLDRAMLGPQLSWRHKFGLGAFAHLLSIELTGETVGARESGRAGLAGHAAIVWRKRLDPATRIALSYGVARHDARASIFDRTGREAALDVARDLDGRWSLTFAAFWRKGYELSYATPPRPDLVSLAKVFTAVDTFHEQRIAYSLDARTLGGSLTASYAIKDRTSVTLGYDLRRTESGPLRYVNHLVSVGLTHEF